MFTSKTGYIQMLSSVILLPVCLCSLTYCISRLSVIIYASNFYCFRYPLGSVRACWWGSRWREVHFIFSVRSYFKTHPYASLCCSSNCIRPPCPPPRWYRCFKVENATMIGPTSWIPQQLANQTPGVRRGGPWHSRPVQTREPRLAVKSKPDSTGL